MRAAAAAYFAYATAAPRYFNRVPATAMATSRIQHSNTTMFIPPERDTAASRSLSSAAPCASRPACSSPRPQPAVTALGDDYGQCIGGPYFVEAILHATMVGTNGVVG
ncbi:hypothetical protein ABIE67_008541 [Streptomyces sp. V4I8]|uniref:hypothetical protein n=1 Tax=Streptomyces sp. V4I8 TaxID=3156469 RepID=UPI0035124B20